METTGGAVGWGGAVNAWHVAGGVFRMGRREWLTETGWRNAYDDGVRTVVDLRNSREAQRRDTDPAVAEAAWSGITIVSAPTEEPDDPRLTAVCGPYLSDPAHYLHNVRLYPEKFVAVFRAVAAAAGAGVVIHCAAGRDRSGMVAAMLQNLAGDPDQVIADGYAKAARGINERFRTHGPPHAGERYIDDAELTPLLERRGRAVVEFVRELETREFLLRNGLSEAELGAVLNLLGSRVAP
ncbi:tyrosine-protein phosphatase [Pseudarthrobacter sp. AL07]|uniref:tyrosine-protein phosphatase n=1 Tax=unclassified Pseudarthrobacter TaxID=2647000 RepID=UPI00249C4ADA|nr:MULTISPECIES: tyrosine-protein phosphatase [unclassified Pseudarthrobacter]MDI3194318.1 tyrosine-protein phosphatase [Pseudarthrobacter sp. AL20]MDI3208385.1 tyrosine-protein phosphatase [Pseudarthrobacter sp. AL07]